MAPEQARGKPVDGRADLFSLGCVMYEMATGQRPFQGEDTMSILTSLALDHPKPPHEINTAIPVELSLIITRLLEKEPAQRFATAREVADGLRKLQNQQTVVVVAKPQSEINPWTNIDIVSSARAVTERAGRVREGGSRPSLTRAARKPLIALAIGLTLLFGGALASYFLIFKTKDGLLVVEVDGAADVRFKQGKLQIYDEAGKLKYELEPSERNKTLPTGTYQIRVSGSDGLKLDTDKFEMTRAGAKVHVSLDQTALAGKQDGKDPDRRAAEWVISLGGDLRVDDEDIPSRRNELPAGKFRLTGIELSFVKGTTEADILKHVPDLKHLTILGMDGSDLSDAGLERLGPILPQLTQIGLTGTRVTWACFGKQLPRMNQLIDLGVPDGVDESVLPALSRLKSLSCRRAHISGAAIVKHLPALHSVYVNDSDFADADVAALKDLRGLDQLGLIDTQITDAGLAPLKQSELTWLRLVRNIHLTDKALDQLKTLEGVKYLEVTECRFSAEGVRKLAVALPKCTLESDYGTFRPATVAERRAAEWVLSVGGTVGVNGEDRQISVPAELPKELFRLTATYLENNQKVTDGGLNHFEECENLRALNLAGTPVTDAGMANFKNCNSLTTLALVNTKVGNAGLTHFRDCKDLAYLDLGRTAVTDAGLANFKECKKLTHLYLFDCQVADEGLANFIDCPNLVELFLGGTRTTDAGLRQYFQGCKSLKRLELRQTQVGDAGIASFKDCKDLNFLDLSATSVGDAGLAHFIICQNLRQILLSKTKVTAAGVSEFSKALPQCKIEWDGGVIEPK
jgi:hypothetical protein